MNSLVMMIKDGDGVTILEDERVWCLIDVRPYCDTSRSLCTQDALDSDSDAEWRSKVVARGGVTCPRCLEIIRAYKAVKL